MEKQYTKADFTLVQENERLLDKPLPTKQLTYFQDAMLRFTKNKYNVIATIILMIMILMSIFVPILTPKELYTETNSALTTLPPRVPLLEKLGILNGTKEYKDQPIDLTTIDPETGLGYPTTYFQTDYILFNTLTNRDIIGTDPSPLYVGGDNTISINFEKTSFAIATPEQLAMLTGTTVQVDIASMDTRGSLDVYLGDFNSPLEYTSWDELTYIGSITEAGVQTIDPLQYVTSGTSGYLVFRYHIPYVSADGSEYVTLNSIAIKGSTGEDVAYYSGWDLSAFIKFAIDQTTENGTYLRSNAVMRVASFRYDVYGALFADAPATIGNTEYQKILADNPGMEDSITVLTYSETNPEVPTSWTFGDGYPLTKVVGMTTITIAGRVYTNYNVMMNGAYSLGFEKTPYFLFGTDVFGKDLFTLIWLGLRTSLLLGFLASIVNIIVGIVWGATSAYYGGQVDILMERFTDIWGSFPQITMIGIITVLIGPGFLALFIFVVYDGWIGAAKVTRTQFYRYKGREYVLAARTLGASDRRIIFKHILPNALGTIITRVILNIPSIIFLEVNLSYLGFGIGNGQALVIGPVTLTGTSIGVILNDGQQQIFAGNLWLITFPTIIVAILMITFNMFGNALRDALNPQLRGSE